MKKYPVYLETFFFALVRFTRAERKGIILIALTATFVLCGIYFFPEQHLKKEHLAEIDRLNDSVRTVYYRKNFSQAARLSENPLSGKPGEIRNSGSVTNPKPAVYIELNRADSARLCTVRGIGPVISRNIVAYRSRLGGFIRKEQLKEVWGIDDENYGPISEQFFINPAVIQKIDINFASSNLLRNHPYFTGSMVERITEARKLKGGWSQLKELIENDILLPDEAEKVAPYVVFGTR